MKAHRTLLFLALVAPLALLARPPADAPQAAALSRYLNALADNGLLLRRMEEPAPPPGFLAQAAEYEAAASIPRLLFLRTEKV